MPKVILAIFFLSSVLSARARADGAPAYLDQNGWHMLAEDAQQAVVALEDGIETLLLQVQLGRDALPGKAEKLVWVTPVPAGAADVNIGVLPGFPEFYGVQIERWLGSKLRDILAFVSLTQVYTAPLFLFALAGKSARGPEGVTVFERIVQDGVEVQLLEATQSEALGRHLGELGVDFPPAGLKALESYLGNTASFVVYRIVDLDGYRKATQVTPGREAALGIQVRFPARTGFFPLAASSAVPGDRLSIVVTTVGFHTAMDPVPANLDTSHYVGMIKTSTATRKALGPGADGHQIPYTRFLLTAPPRDLTTDLRFEPGAPGMVNNIAALKIGGHLGWMGWAFALVVLIGCSLLAGSLARFAFPRDFRPSARAAAGLGLFNVTTLIGLIIASMVVAQRRGAPVNRGVRFALMTSLFFSLQLAGLTGLTLLIG
jgi:hypothetical protein